MAFFSYLFKLITLPHLAFKARRFYMSRLRQLLRRYNVSSHKIERSRRTSVQNDYSKSLKTISISWCRTIIRSELPARAISTLQKEIQKENLKDFAIHKLIKDGSTFHIYISHADGDFAVKKLEKDLKALPMRFNSVNMKLHSNILCVTGITSALNEDFLQQVLQGMGDVLLPFKLIKSKKTKESKGYGWLVFKDIKSAEKCMWMLPKLDLQARALHAGWAGNNVTCEDDLTSACTLYVEGLPTSITSVKDLRQFLSKNDEISFCQFLSNDDPATQGNIAVVEFKTSEAAEQCVFENNGAKVIDGTLELTYAIPGYSGVDFVWNKPINVHFKHAQPRSLQHANQYGVPMRPCLQRGQVGYVRPMHVNMQIPPGYQSTLSQHYAPIQEAIRPQLVGVRPFVYMPAPGLHGIQQHHQHFQPNFQQQYPVSNQPSMLHQAPLQNNSMFPHQQSSIPQSVVEMQPQPLTEKQVLAQPLEKQQLVPSYQMSVKQHQISENLPQEVVLVQQLQLKELEEQLKQRGEHLQQHQEQTQKRQQQRYQEHQGQQKQLAAKESQRAKFVGGQLSQEQLEKLTIQHLKQQQTKQQQQKSIELNVGFQGIQSKQKQFSDNEHQNEQTPKQQNQRRKAQENEDPNQTCANQSFSQQENSVALRCAQKPVVSASHLVTEEQQNDASIDKCSNVVNSEEETGCDAVTHKAGETDHSKLSKDTCTKVKSSDGITNNTTTEELVKNKEGKTQDFLERTKAADVNKQKQKTIQQPLQVQEEIENRKKVSKKPPEKKLALPSKEKLNQLQQQVKRQAEAIQRIAQGKAKSKKERKQERNNNEQWKTVPAKNTSPDGAKTIEKTAVEAGGSLVIKKRHEVVKSSLPMKTIESLKLTDEQTASATNRCTSKIRLAQRTEIVDDSDIKEKRPRLDESSSQVFTTASSSASYSTVCKVIDTAKTKIVEDHQNKEKALRKSDDLVAKASEKPSQNIAESLTSSDNESSRLRLLINEQDQKGRTAEIAKETSQYKENQNTKETMERSLSVKNDKMKTQDRSNQENNQSLDRENITTHQTLDESVSSVAPSMPFHERKTLPTLDVQEKQIQKVFPIVDPKTVNILSKERQLNIDLAPTYNHPPAAILRPIPKLPLQTNAPEFSPMSNSQFSHTSANNTQFQTFTNNQFQPIMRADAAMNPGRKHFVPTGMFNHHQMLPSMQQGQILNENFSTNTHYNQAIVQNPLLMAGHTTHHIARPIPQIPQQSWHNQPMSIPPMMHHQLPMQNRMTYFPPPYTPVLSNIGVNRNAFGELCPKLPERVPKLDTAFHIPFNNLGNMQMKFTARNNMNEEAQFYTPSFKLDPSAQYRSDFLNARAMTNPRVYTAVNQPIPNNTSLYEEIAQVTCDSKVYHPTKPAITNTTHEQADEKISSNNESTSAESLLNNLETDCESVKPQQTPNYVTFKQNMKVPSFNRSVRELISVPFTSDESKLVYLLKKRHQGHPIAQEWSFVCSGLLTSHFRKLWDPSAAADKTQNDVEETKADCVCKREPDTLKCYGCSKQFFGRVCYHCELHPYREFQTDLRYCPYCGIDLVWTEEPW